MMFAVYMMKNNHLWTAAVNFTFENQSMCELLEGPPCTIFFFFITHHALSVAVIFCYYFSCIKSAVDVHGSRILLFTSAPVVLILIYYYYFAQTSAKRMLLHCVLYFSNIFFPFWSKIKGLPTILSGSLEPFMLTLGTPFLWSWPISYASLCVGTI